MKQEDELKYRYAVRPDDFLAFAEHYVEATNPGKQGCELSWQIRSLQSFLLGFFERMLDDADFETQARLWAQRNGALALPAPPCEEIVEVESLPPVAELLTQKEVAEAMGVSPSTVSAWGKLGCPCWYLGQVQERSKGAIVRYNLEQVKAWLAERNAPQRKEAEHEG